MTTLSHCHGATAGHSWPFVYGRQMRGGPLVECVFVALVQSVNDKRSGEGVGGRGGFTNRDKSGIEEIIERPLRDHVTSCCHEILPHFQSHSHILHRYITYKSNTESNRSSVTDIYFLLPRG